MGCMKSKQTFPFANTLEAEKRQESKESFISEEKILPAPPTPEIVQEEVAAEPPGPNVVVCEFANRLSHEILTDAIQQWASNNLKYHDIPYIESEGLDAAS
ncbi:small membrane A-kinase anchor protein [Erinaceus europaeus]|uniref:Small membrane A-kinase anchor protein n=1 Tax=Erinaceus europaeus TaxID=9365 RepID=A0A1S3A441_ERIEU|nr:small membrane A-kinase anchor protein [Erinaceus europaeus]XP_060033561.1 small membrane A-kinase anchor protein [Erinaceus europaeus]XP_060033562.1 small membrane A-kinase anchor protein [Erinaceus europaeus]XP_060033563.1 small membrane A-kinase anchor protein [Erinaceus europaeus]